MIRNDQEGSGRPRGPGNPRLPLFSISVKKDGEGVKPVVKPIPFEEGDLIPDLARTAGRSGEPSA